MTADMSPVLVPKKKAAPPPTRDVYYRAPPDLVVELDAAAEQLELSRNEAMTQLLRFALAEHKKEARAPGRRRR